MNKRINLTKDNVKKCLIKLALPIMATSFIQMAYNMIDMMWVGKDGSDSVAAVGTAGFYPWLGMAFVMISKAAGEIKVSQCVGQNNDNSAKKYVKAAFEINIIFSLLYTAAMFLFNKQLIELFNLGNSSVTMYAREYLIIVSLGFLFYFINPVFTSIFNALGRSKMPFIINTIGLIFNIILDPVLIFGIGSFERLGVIGAAIATALSQVIVTLCFILMIVKEKNEFFKVKLFRNIELKYYKVLFEIGSPVALQNGLFTILSMIMGVIIARFGSEAVAAQKVGSQIESISWMSAEGMAAALTAFVGQNYGAENYDRISEGSRFVVVLSIIWGIFTSAVLIFLAAPIFLMFINEPDALMKGTDYLRILGYSQLFMCIEITINGIFKGIGRTKIPSYLSTVLTAARIPMALILSSEDILGLNGIWWSISITSIFKGILILSIFIILEKNNKLYNKKILETI